MTENATPSATLAAFAAGLQFDAIPAAVLRRTEDLFLDWFASALAGKGARPVEAIESYARAMGPAAGSAEVLISRRMTSPHFAAMVNAAASHYAEQDDVHNGSVFHPAAVVFPAALAVAQELGASGREFLTAVVAGYEVGIRVGEFLGRSHYRIFHTTATAGTLAAAAAAGRLLGLDAATMLHAFGSAGTQAAGLWEFLRDAADSKQLHTAHAASCGLASAYLARAGLTGARQILEGPQGMAAGMSSDADPARLTDRLGACRILGVESENAPQRGQFFPDSPPHSGTMGQEAGQKWAAAAHSQPAISKSDRLLGTRWATAETSFKFHASCRHTHPSADALLSLMQTHGLQADAIESVTALVHQGAIDVLGRVTVPSTVHQAKFSMGTVLGLIAEYGYAGLNEFEQNFLAPRVAAFRDRVRMELDPEVDAAYPQRWIGKVLVKTRDGRTLSARVDEPKGDPGNTLTRPELEDKAQRLAAYGKAASAQEMQALIARIWAIADAPHIGRWLTPAA